MSDAQGIAADRLKSFIERIENLEAEKAEIAESIKEVKAEARSAGFDVKAINEIVKLRRMEAQERAEREQILDVYKQALGMLDGTPLADAAMERDGVKRARASAQRLADMAVEDGGTGIKLTTASGETLLDVKGKRPGRPLDAESAEDLAAEFLKVPGVTSATVVRTTTVERTPPEPHDPVTGELPPKSVSGAIGALKTAMHSPSR